MSGNAIGGGEATLQALRRKRDANNVSSSSLSQDSRVRSQTVRAEIFCEFLCFLFMKLGI